MRIHRWTRGIVAAACVMAFGCQSDSSTPSEPAGELSAALSGPDQALAEAIIAGIQCTFDGGQENAMLVRFRNAVKKKERNQINPLQAMISAQITDVFAKWEEGTHIQSCGTAVVVGQLIADLAAFGGFEELDPVLVAQTLDNGGSVRIFRLEDGGGDVLADGCVGYFIPPQTSQSGWITVLLNEPQTDPGFDGFDDMNIDTAPFWVQIDASDTGPFLPKIQVGWYVIEAEGQFPHDTELGPPPEGAELRACTIRSDGEDGEELLCDEDDDLEPTGGELDQGTIACQSQTAMNLGGWRGLAWNVLQPAAWLIDPNPLYGFPGNTGLRSSFTSPFGITFDEEIEEDF